MYRAAVCLLAVALLAAAIGFSGSTAFAAKLAQAVFALAFAAAGVAILADARHASAEE